MIPRKSGNGLVVFRISASRLHAGGDVRPVRLGPKQLHRHLPALSIPSLPERPCEDVGGFRIEPQDPTRKAGTDALSEEGMTRHDLVT